MDRKKTAAAAVYVTFFKFAFFKVWIDCSEISLYKQVTGLRWKARW